MFKKINCVLAVSNLATDLEIVEKETAATPVREDTQLVFMTIAPRKKGCLQDLTEQGTVTKTKKSTKKGRMNSHKTSQRDHHVRRRHLESSRMLETRIPPQ